MCVTILKDIRAQLIKDRRTRPGERCIYEMMLEGDDEIKMFETSRVESQLAAEPVGGVSRDRAPSNDHGLLKLG